LNIYRFIKHKQVTLNTSWVVDRSIAQLRTV
jgi:hypothetical protein